MMHGYTVGQEHIVTIGRVGSRGWNKWLGVDPAAREVGNQWANPDQDTSRQAQFLWPNMPKAAARKQAANRGVGSCPMLHAPVARVLPLRAEGVPAQAIVEVDACPRELMHTQAVLQLSFLPDAVRVAVNLQRRPEAGKWKVTNRPRTRLRMFWGGT